MIVRIQQILMIKCMVIRLFVSGYLAVLSSCYTPSNNSNNNDGGKNPRTHEHDIKQLKEWHKLDNDVWQNPSPNFYMPPMQSLNGKWLYLATNGYSGNFRTIAITKAFVEDVTDKNNWKKLSLENPAFSDNPGEARLKDQGTVYAINPTYEGMVLAWQGNGSRNGAVIFKGDQLYKAWKDSSLHIRGFSKGYQITNFFMVRKNDGTEILYVANNKNKKLTTGPGLNALNVLGVNVDISNNFGDAKFAQDDKTVFLVTDAGISTLDITQAGTKQKFSAVKKDDPKYGSNEWQFAGTGNDNDRVEAVLIQNGFLYIGLTALGFAPKTGGVAIYDISKDSILAPKESIWGGIGIKQLIRDKDGVVWAVTVYGLYAVKSDGTIEQKLDAQVVKDGQAKNADRKTADIAFTGEMPKDSIMGAVWVDNTLLLTTDKNVYLMTTKTK
jgi:hypothetical protein